LRLFSFGGYGLALAALALMVFGVIKCAPYDAIFAYLPLSTSKSTCHISPQKSQPDNVPKLMHLRCGNVIIFVPITALNKV